MLDPCPHSLVLSMVVVRYFRSSHIQEMSTIPTILPSVPKLAYVDHGSGRTPVANELLFPSSLALPSPPFTFPAAPTGVHISSFLLTNSSTTSTVQLNSRPRPLSPHPQLTYIISTPINKLELQCCDHRDSTLTIVALKSFQLQHKNHANLLQRLDDSSTNSSISCNSSHQERRPSVDTVLLAVALILAGMKRSY